MTQTQEAMATIRMAVDTYDKLKKQQEEDAEDAGDFIACNDDNENSGGGDQFEPGLHWTLGAPRKLTDPRPTWRGTSSHPSRHENSDSS